MQKESFWDSFFWGHFEKIMFLFFCLTVFSHFWLISEHFRRYWCRMGCERGETTKMSQNDQIMSFIFLKKNKIPKCPQEKLSQKDLFWDFEIRKEPLTTYRGIQVMNKSLVSIIRAGKDIIATICTFSNSSKVSWQCGKLFL